jgi:AcrR family transcriptional regulator
MSYNDEVTPPDQPPGSSPGRRRRGSELTAAIYRATLAELARGSFEELSFHNIAAAAGTGKAALYRRWSTPAELVMAALTDPVSGFGTLPRMPRNASLRADLVELLVHLARALDEPRGRALRPLIAHRHRHPELFDEVHRAVIAPHQELVMAVLLEALDRGEAVPGRVTERVAAVGPKLVVSESWERGRVDDTEVEAIVDEVLVPILSPGG